MQIILNFIKKPMVRYIFVGGAAFITEYGSFFILYVLGHVWLTLANTLSYCFAFAVSFLLNRHWTFKNKNQSFSRRVSHQLIYYFGFSLFNLFLTVLLVIYFKRIGVDPRLGKLIAMVLTSLWNFIVFKKIIFRTMNVSGGK